MRSLTLFLLSALVVAGCATKPVSDINAFASRSADNSFEVFDRSVDSGGLVLALVHDRQSTAASCGAHVLASMINYWGGAGTVSGDGLFQSAPPTDAASGYSLGELMAMARNHGLLASAARLSQADVIRELESGRPVLIPVEVPAVYLDPLTLPGQNVPVIGFLGDVVASRAGQASELTGKAMVRHYLVVAGFQHDRFVVVEPVRGFRTISFERLARYRMAFNDAALVMSARPNTGAQN